MQNCVAILQSTKKSMDGFFLAVAIPCFFPASHQTSPDFSFFCKHRYLKEQKCLQRPQSPSFLPNIKKRTDARLSTPEICRQISDPAKNPWRDFFAGRRGLTACRSAKRFCNTWENPRRDFISFLPRIIEPRRAG